MSKLKPFEMEIASITQTRDILSNLKGLLRGQTYSGKDVFIAVESIRFADHLYNESVKQLQEYKDKAKSADPEVQMVTPDELPQLPEEAPKAV